ncbi:hypothetical protein MJH12_08290, partial [bacterium]|nr:hypothetical protein [bacterium]
MIRINLMVLYHAKATPKLCRIQKNSHYLHVEEFHKVDHLSLSLHPYYFTTDDNDFSFHSLIRLLPFVPNLSYIYAYSHFHHSYKVQALWGIPGEFSFQDNRKNKSINMIGIRLAQVAHWVFIKKQKKTLIYWIILILSPYFIEIDFFADQITNMLLLVHLTFCLIIASVLYNLSKMLPKYIQKASQHSILKIKIVQPAILLIAFAYFYQIFHYYHILALIPCFLLTWLFYHLFIPIKMKGFHKEYNAIASQALKRFPPKITLSEFDVNSFFLRLKKYKSSQYYTFAMIDQQLSFSKTFLSFHLYFQLIRKDQGIKIIVYEHYYQLIFLGQAISIAKESFDLITLLEQHKIPFEISYKSYSRIALSPYLRPLVILSLFILWDITKSSIFSIGSPTEQNISKNMSKFIKRYLIYAGNHYIHQRDPINYHIQISKDQKFFILKQINLPSFLQ